MSKKEEKAKQEQPKQPEQAKQQAEPKEQPEAKKQAEPTPEEQIADLKAQLEKQKSEYIFLMAEFDNYRKRTIREKADIIKNGAENALRDLLPVVDDMERALDAISKAGDDASVKDLKEGVDLIYDKFIKYLEKQSVKPMESTGKDFDSDVFDAVTTFPAPDESQKGKVIDTVLKGYTINDKVLRHAKVVVGQ